MLGAEGDYTVGASYLQDISYETLHELGTIKVECDEDLCQVKSDDAIVGMSSSDHVFDGRCSLSGSRSI